MSVGARVFESERELVARMLTDYRYAHPSAYVQDWGFGNLTRQRVIQEWVMWCGPKHPELRANVLDLMRRRTLLREREAWKLLVALASLLYPDHKVGGE